MPQNYPKRREIAKKKTPFLTNIVIFFNMFNRPGVAGAVLQTPL